MAVPETGKISATEMVHEETPLLPGTSTDEPSSVSENETEEDDGASWSVTWAVMPTLLLGVFIAQADSSIVLATSQEIASEFGALSDATWLITTYSLAQCACQPLYGKTSDIFGRKSALMFAYTVFTLGCVLCGIASKFWTILLGRAISGIGGAGMVGLVAVIIADLLPPRKVAMWRSYVNVIATLGRSCGGPTGGWLVDTIGWRWCFLIQCPIAAIAILLIIWRLPQNINASDADQKEETLRSKLARVDFVGFVLLPGALVTTFIALDFAGKFYPWTYIGPLLACGVLLMAAFCYVEKFWAKEPIVPMELVARSEVFVPYLLIAMQTAAQFIITYTIPIYFQIAAGMTVTAASSRIVIIVVGNTMGGLASGWIISRTGRYKPITFAATILGVICYTLVLIRWKGASGWVDTTYLMLGGLGMGTTQSTTFVHLIASLEAKDIAIAGTTWFLSQSAGSLVSINVFNMVHNIALDRMLETALDGVEDKQKIIDGATSSVEYIMSLPPYLQRIVKAAFVRSLVPTNAFALGCGVAALVMTLFMRERKLDKG